MTGRPDLVAGLLRRGGRVLLAHRSPHRSWYPDCWDVPGGHLEPGEDPVDGLVRELSEELGVAVDLPPGAPPWTTVSTVATAGHRLAVWLVDRWEGEPASVDPAEHDTIAWFDAAGLDAVPAASFSDPGLPPLVRLALA